ncbi:MAG: 1-acyl-sn-glycerol-3-phosphate acyltransferase [Fermentimonas sp.]|jgi:1-acyl-sn-glycerol-3-phosphate acyltransferase
MGKISGFIFNKVLRWKISTPPPDIDKCVIVVAPHTSNWDFIIAKTAYSSLGRTANFLIKKEWFFFPFNIFFRSIGGIPVSRGRNHSLTDKLAETFNKSDKMQLAITPEGTRKANKEWKRGFYYIALKADVPLILVGLDYKNKDVSYLGTFIPTGDYDSDIVKIKSHYKGITAKKPENFIL